MNKTKANLILSLIVSLITLAATIYNFISKNKLFGWIALILTIFNFGIFIYYLVKTLLK